MPPSKTADRLAKIRERVAHRAIPEETPAASESIEELAAPPVIQPAPVVDDAAVAAASAHFLGIAEQIVQGRAIEQIPVAAIAPDERPDMRQPRLLPTPDKLIVMGEPAPEYRTIVAELIALGQSLRERQIQPIIVYPGSNPAYPAARYLILVGHRR